MKQKVLNLISWIGFWSTIVCVTFGSMYVGAIVCNWLVDVMHITGWWCLVLMPIEAIVSLAILFFFLQGTKKMKPYTEW